METNIKEWLKRQGAATTDKGQVAFLTLFAYLFDLPARPELWGGICNLSILHPAPGTQQILSTYFVE